MPDHNQAGGGSDISRDSGVTRPQDPHQSQRMGRWNHINSILAPIIPRNPADNADAHKEECARRGQSLLAQFRKSKRNGQMPEHGSSSVMVEGMIAGKCSMDITADCLGKEYTRAFEAERMVLLKTSVCRMESSCVDWKNVDSSAFLRSGVVSSQWQRCAEFNVNQKTQSLVRSKRKYGCWDAGLDKGHLQRTQSEFFSASDELKSVPEEFQFQEEYMVHLSRLYRFFEQRRLCRSGPLWNACVGSTSGCELGGFYQIQDAGPPVVTGDGDNHLVSGVEYKEKLASSNCLNLENEISEPCNHSLLSFSEKKREEKLIMGCLWPMPNDQSPKARGDSPTDVSGSKLLLIKRSSMQGFMELKDYFREQHFQQTIPGFSIHELRRCTTLDSLGRPLGISINDEKDGGQSVDAYSSDVQNESDVGTACLDMDAHRVKSLTKGISPARSDKKDFAGMHNPRKSESTYQDFTGTRDPRKSESISALQKKEATISNQETELLDASLDFFPCIDAADTVEPNGLSRSRRDTMEVGHIMSNVGKPDNSGSGRQPESLLVTEVSSRWVKRLKVNSDSVSIGTGDYNMEDVLTTRRVHKLFSRVMNYSRSNSFTLAKCLQECQQFQKTTLLLRNNDSHVESLKESHPWIQRWCQKVEQTTRPKTRKRIHVLCEPEKTKPLHDNLEGKLFPSLAAMALMGKSINNFRPCEFRRRGSSLVWNTEGF